MQDTVRQKLLGILQQHGTGIIYEPEKFIRLIRQECSGYPVKTDLLVGALTHESVADLLRWKDQLPAAKLVPKLASNLQARLGCSRGEALWALVSWALALDLLTAKEAEEFRDTRGTTQRAETPPPAIGSRPTPPGGWRRYAGPGVKVTAGLVVLALLVYSIRCIDRLIKVEKPHAPVQDKLDPKHEKVRFELQASWDISSHPYDLTFRDSAETLFSLGGDSVLTKWDPTTGVALVTLKSPAVRASSAILSPDGRTLAVSGSYVQGIGFIDVDTSTSAGEIKGAGGYVMQGAFSPDGRFLATCGYRGSGLAVWDLTWKRRFLSMGEQVQSSRPEPISFSPDSRSILVPNLSGSAPTLLQFGTERMEVLRRFEGHGAMATVAVFDKDGARVATASPDNSVRIWDTRSGKELKKISIEAVQDIAFHPNSPILFTRIGNRGVRVWNTETGDEVGRIAMALSTMALSPDGSLLAASGWKATEDKSKAPPSAIMVWRVNTTAMSR